MLKMKNFALMSLLALALPLCSQAAEREWFPYKKLVEEMRLEKFYAIPAAERDKVNLYVTVKPLNKNIKPADVVLTVVHADGRQVMTLSPDYRLTLQPNPKWIAEDARIMTSLPANEKSRPGWDITTPVPDGTQWHYASVMGGVPQANAAIKKMAGMMSMFAPKVGSVILKFAKPAQLRIQSKDGEKVYASDAQGHIKLKPDDALMKENPVLVASERPFEAELDSE